MMAWCIVCAVQDKWSSFLDDAFASLAEFECVECTNNKTYVPRRADEDKLLDTTAILPQSAQEKVYDFSVIYFYIYVGLFKLNALTGQSPVQTGEAKMGQALKLLRIWMLAVCLLQLPLATSGRLEVRCNFSVFCIFWLHIMLECPRGSLPVCRFLTAKRNLLCSWQGEDCNCSGRL